MTHLLPVSKHHGYTDAMPSKAAELLDEFNANYPKLHKKFEDLFWEVRMGDHSRIDRLTEAEKERDAFRADTRNLEKITAILGEAGIAPDLMNRLKIWEDFFKLYQTPPGLAGLREEIARLESQIEKKFATQTEGYIDPHSGEFVPASKIAIRMIMQTNPDEKVRQACFTALEKMATAAIDDLIRVAELRNRYARTLGYEDFYAYRLALSEGMTKKEVFTLFEEIYEGSRNTFEAIRVMEKTQPGLRRPWNFGYMMSGSFVQEEDPYYDFDEALMRWGRSFAALGIDFKGGTLQLDLLDRPGKYNNGFCHYPDLVNFNGGKRNPGSANFTCNVVYGQPGAGHQGMLTLFHEGGHAADRLNAEEQEVCLNTEWPPASTAWAETHSQFLDTLFSSIEWRTRYAKDKAGNSYPMEIFERKVRKLRILAPLRLNSIIMVSDFERRVYEAEKLTPEKLIAFAKEAGRKYNDFSEESILVLSIPHIYSWDSSAYYHAYGLAILALEQWRKYFYDKYGYIVDNPDVGREMTAVWKLSSAKKFGEFVEIATGKKLSTRAFLENSNMSAEEMIAQAKARLEKMKAVPEHMGAIKLNAKIRMVHGTQTVADNSESFETMAKRYADWLHSRIKSA